MNSNERKLDTIIYIMSLSISAHRFAKNMKPFDFEELTVGELLHARCMPFVKNVDVDFEEAHKSFLMDMFQNGWKCGPENFVARTHPDLKEWSELSQESKEMVAFTAALVCSAQDFYLNFRADVESELMDSFNPFVRNIPFNRIREVPATH
jgi:hypothetical protein